MGDGNLYLRRPLELRRDKETGDMASSMARVLAAHNGANLLLWLIGGAGERLLSLAEGRMAAEVIKSRSGEAGAAMAAAAGAALQGNVCVVAGSQEDLAGRNSQSIFAANLNQADVIFIGLDEPGCKDILKNLTGRHLKLAVPVDGQEAGKVVNEAIKKRGTRWISTAWWPVPEATTSKTPYNEGRTNLWKKGHDLAIIATGPAASIGLMAAEEVVEKSLSCSVWQVPGLGMPDEKNMIAAIKECGQAVTVGYGEEGELLALEMTVLAARNRMMPPDALILEKPGTRDANGAAKGQEEAIEDTARFLVKTSKKKQAK